MQATPGEIKSFKSSAERRTLMVAVKVSFTTERIQRRSTMLETEKVLELHHC